MSNLALVKFLAWVRDWHILRGLPFLRESHSSITAFINHSKLTTLCMTSSRFYFIYSFIFIYLFTGGKRISKIATLLLTKACYQPRPQGLLSYWDGDEKALASAGHMTIKTPSLSGCHKLLKL